MPKNKTDILAYIKNYVRYYLIREKCEYICTNIRFRTDTENFV